MSYKQQQLNVNNVTSHTHTMFDLLATEAGQQKIVDAINNINISAEIGEITVESSDTQTHTLLNTTNSSLSDINNNISSIDSKINGILTTDEGNNLLVYSTNIADTPLISGFATEETLSDIKTKTDNLNFFDNSGTLELNTFDSQVYTAVGNVTTAINDKHLDSTTDSVTVTGSVSIDTSGLALETTLSELNDKIKSDTVHTDAIQVEVKNTSLTIGNFPTSTEVSNFPTSTEVSNFPTSFEVSNFPTSTEVSNFPTSTEVSNFPTSFEVSNFPTDLATETTLQSINDKVNNDSTYTDAIQVAIKNTSLVVDPINNSINEAPFDLIINGPTVYANSLPTPNPFFADPNGREGWYYDNQSNILNKSNIYWYANPTSGNLQENDMTFAQLSGMYSIITCDYVDNGSLTIPTMGVYSQPTGTNDFIPTFAHSRWVYQLSGANLAKLRKGETILIYTGATRPNVHINLPSYPLQLATQNGDALSTEIIAYMTVNTQATTSKIGYLLQYCGYLNSSIGFNREYSFLNSQKRLTEQNLSSLTFEPVGATNQLYVYSQPIISAIQEKNLEFGYDKVDVSGSSVSISNLPLVQEVSGTIAFSNTSIDVTGTIAFSNTSIEISSMPHLNYNLDSVTIVPNGDTLPISGSINNLFTLDTTTQSTNTKLDTIHADLDGLTFDGSSNLNVNVAAGSITVSSVNIKDSAGNNLNSTSNALNTYITNVSIPITGTVEISNTSFNVNTQDGSGNEITSTNLLSGKLGLDTASNIFCYDGSSRTAITCDGAGKMNVKSHNADYLGNGITSTTTSISGTATNSLDTSSSLYTSNGTVRTPLTSTLNTGKQSLDVNVSNTVPISGTIAISNTGFDANLIALHNTTPTDLHCSAQGGLYCVPTDESGHHQNITNDGNAQVMLYDGTSAITSTTQSAKNLLDTASRVYSGTTAITATGTSLNVNVSNTVPVSGTFYQSTQPVALKDGTNNPLTSTDTTATQRSLDTASCLYTTDATTRIALTSTLNGAKQSLDVNVSNTSLTVSNAFTLDTTTQTTNTTLTTTNTKLDTGNGYLNTINQGIGYSYLTANALNNVASIAGNTTYSTFYTWTRGQYGRNSVLVYNDSSTANTDSISIYSKDGLGNDFMIGLFYPVVVAGSRRWTLTMNLLPFNQISVRNNSSSSISNVNLILYTA